jgi:hypothetical protein
MAFFSCLYRSIIKREKKGEEKKREKKRKERGREEKKRLYM